MKILSFFISLLFLASCSLRSNIETNIIPKGDQSISTSNIEKMIQEYHRLFDISFDVLSQKTQSEQEELKKSQGVEMSNIEREYLNLDKIIPKFIGKISYLTVPESMNNLGLFKQQVIGGPVPEFGEYTENTGSYTRVGNIQLSNGTTAQLFHVEPSVFYSHSPLLYFIQYDGEYYYIPSISVDGNGGDIVKIFSLQKWLIRKNIHLFEESRFTNIFKKDFTLPEKISYIKNEKHYRISFKGKHATIFTPENLRKIEDLSLQFGRPIYIEKAGPKKWFDTEFQELEKLRIGTMTGYELYEKIDPTGKEKHEKRLMQQGLFESDALYVEMPDHTTALYQIEIPFLEESEDENSYGNNSIKLIQGDTTHILKDFSYQDPHSCGIKDGTYLYVPDGRFYLEEMRVINVMEAKNPKKWKNRLPQDLTRDEFEFHYQESDLAPIGSAGSGETILFFKNLNHPFLHAMYEYGYQGELDMQGCLKKQDASCPKKLLYADYIKTIPVFFWRDPFDRIVFFIGYNTITPNVCGAKPVIYLYPREKLNVAVSLDWNTKHLISIPEYNNGWHAVAYPDGKLDIRGTMYPYLFWEDNIRYPKPSTGFVIARDHLDGFLSEKLSFLGMNTREIGDFKEYWLPQMQTFPYYRMSFLMNDILDQSAPITILPKPDSMQRIFVDFIGLNAPIILPEQHLIPFVRTGFSVIEWGGKKQD